MSETSRATAEDIIEADQERTRQAIRAALSESGPYPENEWQLRRWCRGVNRRFRKALKRLN